MTSIVSTITSFCGKRKIGEISIDNTEILEKNKIKLWKAAVNPNNSKRNKFITVHGNINETILANEYCKNRYKNNDNTDSNNQNTNNKENSNDKKSDNPFGFIEELATEIINKLSRGK